MIDKTIPEIAIEADTIHADKTGKFTPGTTLHTLYKEQQTDKMDCVCGGGGGGRQNKRGMGDEIKSHNCL